MTKAKTRAGKRRARVGRPLDPGAERTPGGRKRRTAAAANDAARDVMSVALDARQRLHGAPPESAKEPEWGYVLGRIWLDGRLGNKTGVGRSRLDAGVRYAEAMSRYYGMTGIPQPSVRAQDLFRVHGYDGDIDEERGRAVRRATDKAMALEGVLLRLPQGRHVATTVKNICLMDMEESRTWPDHMITLLIRGLDAVILHMGLQGEDKSVRVDVIQIGA